MESSGDVGRFYGSDLPMRLPYVGGEGVADGCPYLSATLPVESA